MTLRSPLRGRLSLVCGVAAAILLAAAAAPLAQAQDKPGTSATPPAAPADPAAKDKDKNNEKDEKAWTDAYTLDTCPISGEKLGSMGEPVVHSSNGREIRFCCKACVKPFEEDAAKHLAEIDKKIVEQQLPLYPLTTCIVETEDSLTEPGAKPVNYVYNNRLVRFCCKECIKEFNADPRAYIKKLNEAVIAAQKPAYAMTTCPVSGETLGSMGEPVDAVIGNRLVRLCCKDCKPMLKKDPQKYLAMVPMPAAAKSQSGDDAAHDDEGKHTGHDQGKGHDDENPGQHKGHDH